MGYLELIDLCISYGKNEVVRGLSLSINKSELYTFLGPSGSGKTTIMLCVAGFLRPNRGRIILDRVDITNAPACKRQIGMVFQSYTLFPHKNVFQNIAYPLQVRRERTKLIKNKVAEMLKLVHLEGFDTRMPSELSGGQQQRVALARSLIFSPRILVLDEPLGALDKQLREEMQLEIRRIQRQSEATTLYVTHDQNEAMAISDKIAILNNGLIEQSGAPQAIYKEPINPFVANFVGGANLLPASVGEIRYDKCQVYLDGIVIEEVAKPQWLVQSPIDVTLMIRPEQIVISKVQDTKANGIACRVEERLFLGDVQYFHCRTNNNTVFSVKQAYTEDNGIEPGDDAYIFLLPESIRLYPECNR